MLIAPTILFGHPAYQLAAAYKASGGRERFFEARTIEEVEAQLPEADVLVVSRLWRNDWIGQFERLKFIQSVSAGTEQYDTKRLGEHGIRLASAQGVNMGAVSEHALALILSLTRLLHLARDRQSEHLWRTAISNPQTREQELGGKVIAIVGLGQIGLRIATLARAFDMRVIGINRSGKVEHPAIESAVSLQDLDQILPAADIVVLACPLTRETEKLINEARLHKMKRSAILINVARGRVVDQDALVAALSAEKIAGAGLDCFHDEPLPASSPLWNFKNVLITPHSAGETRSYEINVINILNENLERLARGDAQLRNQVV